MLNEQLENTQALTGRIEAEARHMFRSLSLQRRHPYHALSLSGKIPECNSSMESGERGCARAKRSGVARTRLDGLVAASCPCVLSGSASCKPPAPQYGM
jgi:hypothetical protein